MRVLFLPKALKALAQLPEKQRAAIVKRAEALASEPYPPGFKKLQGVAEPTFRIRAGAFRVPYTVRGDDVYVVGVGDRKEVYR